MLKKTLLNGTGILIACLAGHGAFAQTAQGSDNEQLESITVTATRHASVLQDTPATMNVVSGADVQQSGAKQLNDVLNDLPAVFLEQDNKGLNVEIRGVGSSLDSAAGDPGVNVNLDGVYMRQSSQVAAGLYDLNRIEVVKGPQGTLYGRNATGGVVNILTNDPGSTYEIGGSLAVGNYESVNAEAYANVPLTDTLSMRVAGAVDRHDGYLTSGQDDADRVGARIKLLYTPSEALRLLVGGSYTHDGGEGVGAPLAAGNGRDGYVVRTPAGALDNPVYNLFAQADADVGFGTLTFIPTYTHYRYNYAGTFGFYANEHALETQETMELRLSSKESSKITWVGGLYFYNDNLNNTDQLPDLGILNLEPKLGTKSYAGFGDVTVPVLSDLRVLAGIRYTRDQKSQDNTFVTSAGQTFGPLNGSFDSSAVNWRAGLEYDVAPRVMAYGTVSTGYKAGGFYPDAAGHNTYQPETLTAYEAGVKSRFLDNRLQLNLSLYDYDYKRYQVSTLGITSYGGFAALVFNAQGNTQIYGAELQANYKLTAFDRIDFSLSPLHTRFGHFEIAPPAAINVSGKQLPYAPATSGSFGYTHDWNIGAATLRANADVYFQTSYWAEFSHSALSQQSGYTKTSANLTYMAPSGHWSATLYGRNLEDTRIVALLANTPSPTVALEPPRTFGIRLTFN